MNIEHLRKQAKTLVKLYPASLAEQPSALPLSCSQRIVAQLNGYPDWEALIESKGTVEGVADSRHRATVFESRDVHYMRGLHLWQPDRASCALHERRLKDKGLISEDAQA
mgnify:CR=1 FL=1